MQANIYNTDGKTVGTITLPERVFGVAWNEPLMHQVVTSMEANARARVAHTKTRGEVRGGGRKPWQQKGTGRARHGSIRSPIWRGGGVTHGPRNEKIFARAIPKKMRAKALAIALSRKFRDGEIVFVDSFGFTSPKTALAKRALEALATSLKSANLFGKKNAALVALPEMRDAVVKSFRNIANTECRGVRDLNPVSVLSHAYVVLENPTESLALLEKRIPAFSQATVKRSKKGEENLTSLQKGDQ